MTKSDDCAYYDVVIVGGGLVGASLAVALAPTGLSLAVVEAVAVDEWTQPSFDERTVALTYNARQIYTGMGVWAQIAARHAQPIREIHISDRSRFGMAHLHHNDIGTEALGYVVPSRVLGEVLHQRMARSDAITLFCPATVERYAAQHATHADNPAHNLITIIQPQKTVTLKAALVVVADGGRTKLAGQAAPTAQAGATPRHTTYPQSAIVSVVNSDRDHHDRAFERFTDEGPLALLPHSDKRYALVWTTEQRQLAARMALSDAAFIHALQQTFGDRAGNFTQSTARKCYPLHRSRMENPVGARTVTIGNAAHSVHPVAGQGFNLGLRDVAVLAEILARARRRQQDIGSAATLGIYSELRRRDARKVSGFTDGLIRLFGNRRRPVVLARNLALAAIEMFPPAKRLLLRRTMGMAEQRSRLGAGLPLR